MRYSIIVLFLSLIYQLPGQEGDNKIQGKLMLPTKKQDLLQRGTNYKKSSNAAPAEKKRIDRLNVPEENIFISAHPLDFQPTLKKTDVQITQRAKTFLPNIVAITKGSTVFFLNEDEHYHNIHSLTSKARFNIGRRPPGNIYGQKINKAGIVKLGCDIHPDMGAVILSLDTPYFTKIKPDGTFELSGLPDGNYELRTYHPAFESSSQRISVTGNTIKQITINLKPKA